MSQVPQITGMHDGAAMIAAEQKMREAFAQLLTHPGAAIALQSESQRALQSLHLLNVQAFGWRDAEVIRSEAFAAACETTLPVGDATESDFGDFLRESL